MCKPKNVAISQRIKYYPQYQEYRDELDHRYIDWVIKSGHIPVPIPNTLLTTESDSEQTILKWLESFNIQAIILSGGNDIGEFKQRDNTEEFLLTWAESKQFPVLGICRGMQFMGVRDGANLVEVTRHVGTTHSIHIHSDEQNHTREVNSYHNYALESCPDSFSLLATCEQGFPEAIVHKSLPWQAWMWHPEREDSVQLSDLKQLQELINNV